MADYGRWERQAIPQWTDADLDYWRRTLADPPAAFLPVPDGSCETESSQLVRQIDARTVSELRRSAARYGAPPLTGLVAASALAFARVLGARDLCLGTITHGRVHSTLEPVVGCFINPLPLVLRAVPAALPAEALQQTAGQLIAALDHSRIPFDELVRILRPARDRHPWFQALIVLQDEAAEGLLGPGFRLDPVRVHQPRTSREWLLQAFPLPAGGWELAAHWRRDGLATDVAEEVLDEVVHAMNELAGPAR